MAGQSAWGEARPAASIAQEIAAEAVTTRQRLTDLRQEKSDPWPLLGFLAIAVVIEALALGSSFIVLWVIGSFTLYCYSFITFFLPTTRDRKKGKGAPGHLKADAITIAKKRRIVVGMAYFRCFLYNAAAQAMAFVVIFTTSMFVAAISLYLNAIDPLSVAAILASSLLIMSFYGFVLRFRPYTPAYAGKLRAEGLKLVEVSKDAEWLRYLPFALGSFFILAAALIAALLLPGLTLSKLVNLWQFSLGANVFTYLLTVVIQYLLVRGIQSIESKRVAIAFLERRSELLQETLTGKFTEEEMKIRLSTLRIFKVDRHDFFRRLPVYNVNPNIAGIAHSGDLDEDLMQRML